MLSVVSSKLCLDRCRNTRDHDVHKQTWVTRGRASKNPRAAHFAGRVLESCRAAIALPDVPAKDLLVELSKWLPNFGPLGFRFNPLCCALTATL
jgi:hypothetical protein